jgi:hypothetical protein
MLLPIRLTKTAISVDDVWQWAAVVTQRTRATQTPNS